MNDQSIPMIGNRRVVIDFDAPPADSTAIVQTLTRLLTGGDPVNYVRKLASELTPKEAST